MAKICKYREKMKIRMKNKGYKELLTKSQDFYLSEVYKQTPNRPMCN